MFRTPQLQAAAAELLIDRDLLGRADEGVEEDVAMPNINPIHLQNPEVPSPPGRPIDDYENLSMRSVSVMSVAPEPPNARNYFDRIPSPNLNINSNFSRPPYLNDNRRSGANTPNQGYRSANEADQRREQQRYENPQLPRSASFNAAARSNYNYPPPPIRNGDYNSYNQQPGPPPGPHSQEPYMRNDQQYSPQQQHGPQSQDVRADQFSHHSPTHDSYNALNSPHLNNNQEPYFNEQGYRTIPPQSFHSEPRRDRYDYGMPGYNNGQFRPRQPFRRPWRPPVTNNFNFINIPMNHQFYGYPQQAQQMIDYAQSAASLATLRTSYQHDYNIARNTQRVIPVKEEDEDDIAVLFEGPPKDPKSILSTRKRKSSSTATSSSSPHESDDSVIVETASNATLTSQIPSKQSRTSSKKWSRSPSSTSNCSLPPHPFSSAPELTAYHRDVQTPIPEMIGLRIATVSPAANDEVEEGEIVEIDRAKKSPMQFDKIPLDRRPPVQSAEIPHDRLPPLKSAEIPLDRLPRYMMPKPVEAIEPTLDEHNASTATVANLPPSHPNYDPLLDDFDDGPVICNAEAFDLDDADDLLDDDDTRAEKKAKEDEDHVLKKFPDLKLTDNHPDEHMNQ